MKIFHLFDEENAFEGFMDEQGKVLACWYENDAMWRGEYMDCLMKAVGVEISYKPTAEMQKAFATYRKKNYS